MRRTERQQEVPIRAEGRHARRAWTLRRWSGSLPQHLCKQGAALGVLQTWRESERNGARERHWRGSRKGSVSATLCASRVLARSEETR
jgi:hypothetical protein